MDFQEATKKITDAISEVEKTGLSVWIRNDCCGCSKMDLWVSTAAGDDSDGAAIPGV